MEDLDTKQRLDRKINKAFLEKQVENQMASYTKEKIKNLYKFLDDKSE